MAFSKVAVVFYRTPAGAEVLRDWLKSLPEGDRKAIGLDLMRVQFGWPVGMPICRPLGDGLFEVRSDLAGNRIARVLFAFVDGRLLALHGFIKKTQRTPAKDIELARRRRSEFATLRTR